MRCASFSPRFGENQVRTCASPTRIGSLATLPDPSTFRFFHSCAKSSWKRIATPVDSTTTMTFSSRVHESSVQFVEPLQTASRSRTTYLWCIRSGQPGTRRGLERQRLDQVGLRLRRWRHGRTLVGLVDVVDEPNVNAALVRADERIADDVARLILQPDVVERELERLACDVDERRDLARDVQ